MFSENTMIGNVWVWVHIYIYIEITESWDLFSFQNYRSVRKTL